MARWCVSPPCPNRRALPVFLIVEDKDGPAPEAGRQLDALDATLRTALPGRLLVRPDEVAGRRWPTLAQTRGRVVPILIGDLADAYSRSGTTLADVNRLLKGFDQMQTVFKALGGKPGKGMRGKARMLRQLKGLDTTQLGIG